MNEIKFPPLVIYTVKINDCNRTAWYSANIGDDFDAVLDIVDSPLKGRKIMFRTLKYTTEIRFIELHHAVIKCQRFASNKDYV